MRADRLVATLLLLQTRGRVTAADVAAELEVSERTARRDLESLSMAGVPVYSRQGRNGGWELVGGARTDLSGLAADEVRALFLVAGPAAAATPDVRTALRKLLRALPEPFRAEAEAASSAIVIDPTGWGRTNTAPLPAPAHLDTLQHAVIAGIQVRLGYVDRQQHPSERVVHPLGLATKGQVWYLVADTAAGLRTFRVSRVTSAELTGDAVERPEGFDLAEAWKLITSEVNERWRAATARAVVVADIVPVLRRMFGPNLKIGPATPDGRVEVELAEAADYVLAGRVAAFGDAVEVVDPPEVRAELRRIGEELAARYAG